MKAKPTLMIREVPMAAWIWMLLFAVIVLVALRIIDGTPIRYRNVLLTEIEPYLTTFIVNSRAQAWVRIGDPTLPAWVVIRKLSSDGTKLQFTVHPPQAIQVAIEPILRRVGEISIVSLGPAVSRDVEAVVTVSPNKLISGVSTILRDLFGELGCAPGLRVIVEGRGSQTRRVGARSLNRLHAVLGVLQAALGKLGSNTLSAGRMTGPVWNRYGCC